MSNNIYCVPDEKDSLKQAYIVFISLEEEGKKDKITANACLRQNEFMHGYIYTRQWICK